MLRAMVLCLIAVVVMLPAASAALTPVPIEGTILASASDVDTGLYAYFIEGSSDNVTPAPGLFLRGEISPYMDQVAYALVDTWPGTTGDVWVANIDGSGAVNLTALAGLGGVSCNPAWSPDATQIAFHRAEPTSELKPCDAGWQVWVMNADGTGAHQVMPEGSAPSWSPAWSPDGSRLVFNLSAVGVVSADVEGADQILLPNVADWPDWSPDGASLASTTFRIGTNGAESGVWTGLLITNADGSNPRQVFERFVSDADVAAHLALYESQIPSDLDPVWTVQAGVGPGDAKWSPRGNRILVQMAYPFDPDGPFYTEQSNLWLYDLDAEELVQITESGGVFEHSWDGDNTLPDDPEVTVDDVTVDFGEVGEPGVTTIVLEPDPPALPDTYRSASDSYVLATTAVATGPAEVSMGYDAAAVPDAAESHLKLLRYDDGLAQWKDITSSRDLTSHVVTGTTSALGLMELSWPLPGSDFSDVSDSQSDPFWALWEIQAAGDAGIVQGYEDGSYHPAEAVNRAQMAVYMARSLAGGDSGVPATPSTVSFPDDVPDTHWAYKYVEYAVDEGVVQGYDATHYSPDVIVTRDQMAVFVARAKGWVSLGEALNTAPELFSDVPAGFWSGLALQACVAHGVVNGYSDNTYHPEREVTRDQMAVYVARAFGLGG
jgi:hypothetical protein